MRINYLLIGLDNTFKKEKELNKGFSLFNFSLIFFFEKHCGGDPHSIKTLIKKGMKGFTYRLTKSI
jgi:hypothetical protein